jgi:hypothetical protein
LRIEVLNIKSVCRNKGEISSFSDLILLSLKHYQPKLNHDKNVEGKRHRENGARQFISQRVRLQIIEYQYLH